VNDNKGPNMLGNGPSTQLAHNNIENIIVTSQVCVSPPPATRQTFCKEVLQLF